MTPKEFCNIERGAMVFESKKDGYAFVLKNDSFGVFVLYESGEILRFPHSKFDQFGKASADSISRDSVFERARRAAMSLLGDVG